MKQLSLFPESEPEQNPYSHWSSTELERKEALERGEAVLINKRKGKDTNLIAWASSRGLLVDIDHGSRSIWGNPFYLKNESQRDQVCDQYEEYLNKNETLLNQLHTLKGKALVCWCYPKRCHGNTLIKKLDEVI